MVIRRGMWRAVNAAGGTAFGIRKGAVEMAGKTGTAPIRIGRVPDEDERAAPRDWDPNTDHAWFAGWAPYDRPQIVVVVFIEHGGGGGKVAAPVARQIVDGYFTQVLPRQRGAGASARR
jgi:penicillin-binding protein 2